MGNNAHSSVRTLTRSATSCCDNPWEGYITSRRGNVGYEGLETAPPLQESVYTNDYHPWIRGLTGHLQLFVKTPCRSRHRVVDVCDLMPKSTPRLASICGHRNGLHAKIRRTEAPPGFLPRTTARSVTHTVNHTARKTYFRGHRPLASVSGSQRS